ncbi:MAG: T9SS type A sorting domain-containing protein [Bacteroidales bacterium]|nr:T9SS type A sorting domain-containing protein [Bacteroidales bacterium]
MDYDFPTTQTRTVTLYNIIGKKVAKYTLTDSANTLTFPQLPKGIYMYSIMENNQSVKCGKYVF